MLQMQMLSGAMWQNDQTEVRKNAFVDDKSRKEKRQSVSALDINRFK